MLAARWLGARPLRRGMRAGATPSCAPPRRPDPRWSRRRFSEALGASNGEGHDALKKLALLAEADPGALARVSRSLSSRTLRRLGDVVRAEAPAAQEPVRPTREQLTLVALAPMPLFIVFGVIDNAVMIVAGEYFDMTLGIMFGLSTMAAAGLGNLVSDVLGLGVGGVVEEWFDRRGWGRDPGLTRVQEGMPIVRRMRFMGNAVGVSIGCLLGMFPLLFMDFDNIARLKRQSKVDELFEAVVENVSEMLGTETAFLYVVDHAKKELWTRASVGGDSRSSVCKLRFPLNEGIAGHCATSGEMINTSDEEVLKRYGSNSDRITGRSNESVLCTPIFGRSGDIIGVLQVSNRTDHAPFRVKDELALTAMSSHISCALERAFEEQDGVDPSDTSSKERLLRGLRTSFEHHSHHLRFATSRAEDGRVELVGAVTDTAAQAAEAASSGGSSSSSRS